LRERQVVARREADYTALTRGLAGSEERTLSLLLGMIARHQQCREIIPEHIGVGVGRINLAADTLITGAEGAGRIVLRTILSDLLNLTEPGTLGAVGRNEKPFPR
jgi:hypothetical protein